MPIFDFDCKSCGERFEALVRRESAPACPNCAGTDVERQFPMPVVQSESTKRLAMRAAKQRDAAQARDRMHERIRYEQSHDRHG